MNLESAWPTWATLPRHVRVLLGALLLAALFYLPEDWSRLVTHAYRLSPLSNGLKLLSSLLAAGIAWTIPRREELDEGDRRRFARLFVLVVLADALFMLHLEPVGVLLFMVFHGLCCARNLVGFRAALSAGRIPLRSMLLLSAALLVAIAFYLVWLLPQVTDPALAIGVPIYVLFIFTSLMGSLVSRWIAYRPRGNRNLMALGMILFFCCDLTVGCNLIWPPDGRAQVWSSSLTWLFYAPALALIATSGHRIPATRNGQPLSGLAVLFFRL